MEKKFYLLAMLAFCSIQCNLEKISELNLNLLDASFTYSVDCYSVTFVNTSPEGETFEWDFGDKQSATVENPTVTYAQGGTYPVTLKVSNGQGSGSATVNVEVDPATFEREFGNTAEDEQGIGIIQRSDGSFVASGVSFDKIFGLEIDACGGLLNNKLLSSEENIAPGNMIRLSNGQLAFTGFNNNGNNGFLFLFNEDLTGADLNNYAAPTDVSIYYNKIMETSNEQLVLYGKKYDTSGGWGMAFRKVDLGGKNRLAEKRYDGGAVPGDGTLIEIENGHFLLYGVHSDRIRVVELDDELELVQGGTQFDYVNTPNIDGGYQNVKLEPLSNGDLALYGTRQGANGEWLPYLIKTRISGGVLFDKSYTANDFQNAVPNFSSLQVRELDDGFIFAGSADGFGRFFLMRTDLNGDLLWDKIYGTYGSAFHDLKITSDGGFILTGSGAGAVDEQIFVLRTDEDGDL